MKEKEELSNVFCTKPLESSLFHQMFISRELIESRLKIPFMLLHEMQIKGRCLSFHINSLRKKKNFKLLLFKEILGFPFKVFRLYIPQPG